MLELSFLLWATQGIKHIAQNGTYFRKTVPSAGARHPFETYLAITKVDGITPGVYRFLASQNALLLVNLHENLPETISELTCGQSFCGNGCVFFIWTVIPYRTEWRYGSYAMKGILLDAGHVGQNLYLACESAGLGTCGIAAYIQEKSDRLIGVNGEDEFSIYMAPVGYPQKK
jgi:SagB-type dehydrogenase family enzyme